jgi:hypothetical protein
MMFLGFPTIKYTIFYEKCRYYRAPERDFSLFGIHIGEIHGKVEYSLPGVGGAE